MALCLGTFGFQTLPCMCLPLCAARLSYAQISSSSSAIIHNSGVGLGVGIEVINRKVFIFGLNTPVHQSRITGSMRSATFWCASFRSSK